MWQLVSVIIDGNVTMAMVCFPGPRFVMNPIKIFAGSFGGATLWSNPEYVSPNLVSVLVQASCSYKIHFYFKRKSNVAY